MNKAGVAGVVAGAVTLAVVAFVVFLLLIKVLWAWTVPDLFPGAVSQGLIAREISWGAAVKLAIVLAVFAGLGKHGGQSGGGKGE